MKSSISLKLSLLVGGIVFIVAITLGHYINNTTTNALDKKAGESLITLSKNIADILDREMLERYREIQFAATLSPLTNENSSVDEKRAFLEKIKGNHNHHEWIGFALPDGTVQAGTNKYLEGKNAKARPWLPAGLKGPYIGDVHDALLLAKLLPNTSGESIYFTDVAFPVKNKDGKVLGVLCTHLMWQWTRDVIRSIQKDNNVDIFLLSKDNLILVGPGDSERKQLSEISTNVDKVFATNETTYKTISWNSNENFLTAQTLSKGFEEYKGFGWKVIVRQPTEIAFKDANVNSKKILIYSIVAGIIGAILGIIIANFLVSPIKKLYSEVIKFKNGEEMKLDEKISSTEISELQNALKELQNSLKSESLQKDAAQQKVNIALKIFDQSLEGILITDKHNNITLVNKAFTDITGYKQNEIYGKNPSILSSGQTEESFYKEMWKEIKEKGKWNGTITNKRKDNTLYKEYLKITTLKDKDGQIINYLATFNSSFN